MTNVNSNESSMLQVCELPGSCSGGFYWFGYYDKLQFDPSGRYILCNEVDFEGRSPEVHDRIRVGMVDRESNNRWSEFGNSSAWCWQQGCMLQWIPGSESRVIWNDRAGDGFCAHILDVKTGDRQTLAHPVYALSPDGKTALSLDFARTGRLRPGYGYAGEDPSVNDPAPDDCGIYRVDLESGAAELIISIARIAGMPSVSNSRDAEVHWFNHILVNPAGDRFIFLHRWQSRSNADGSSIRGTRALTAAMDGSDLRVIHDHGYFSHFIWRDEEHVFAWTMTPDQGEGFYLIDEQTCEYRLTGAGAMTRDGHCSYLPGGEWIVCDTYPSGRDRNQQLYIFNVEREERVDLGVFPAPEAYSGEWRCDLHPRCSPDGKFLTIDSTHGGSGRRMYVVELSPWLL